MEFPFDIEHVAMRISPGAINLNGFEPYDHNPEMVAAEYIFKRLCSLDRRYLQLAVVADITSRGVKLTAPNYTDAHGEMFWAVMHPSDTMPQHYQVTKVEPVANDWRRKKVSTLVPRTSMSLVLSDLFSWLLAHVKE